MQSWIYTCICIIQLDISVQGPARGQQIYLGLTLGSGELQCMSVVREMIIVYMY
jgi:hypothetical protein